ncbi:hypothetical protein PSACC_03724 [Paramicrosporidium saccamoebae]|uniref:Uncharacterized protein n=1 Tax=Paramicrosporidium saccamoebae TaxID=1246581 RepID=A0A2H9TFU1_9FUNG|nr:hypothetical protein PSACC_03724 [Paramicrosporidium saccamoebae]
MFTLQLLPVVACLQLTTRPSELCQRLSSESLRSLFQSVSVAPMHVAEFAKLLSTRYYPLQAEYERIVESSERCAELAEVDAPHHASILSIGKLGFNSVLVSNVLSEEKLKEYQGGIATENFEPSLFHSFPIRLRLVKSIVRNAPASIECTDWQQSLLSGLQEEEKAKMIAEAWDVIDFKHLVPLLFEMDRLEEWSPYMILPPMPPHSWNLGFLRLLHLVNALKWHIGNDKIQGKALSIMTLIKNGQKGLASIDRSMGKGAILEEWLTCEHGKKRECYSPWKKIVEMVKHTARLYPELAGNQIVALVQLAFRTKSNDTPPSPFAIEWALEQLKINSLYPAVADELEGCIKDRSLTSRRLSLEKWLFSVRLILDRRSRFCRAELLPGSVLPLETLATILDSWADRVVLNLMLRVPARMHDKLYPTRNLQDLVEQAMLVLQSSDRLFKIAYRGAIGKRGFVPARFTKEQRKVLLDIMIARFPESVADYGWQQSLLEGMNRDERVMLLARYLDLIEIGHFIKMGVPLMKKSSEAFIQHLSQEQDPLRATAKIMKICNVLRRVSPESREVMSIVLSAALTALEAQLPGSMVASMRADDVLAEQLDNILMSLEHLIADHDSAFVIDAAADTVILSSIVNLTILKLLIDKARLLCQPKLEMLLRWIFLLPNGEERSMAWALAVSGEIAREDYSPRDVSFKQWALSMRSLAIESRRFYTPLRVPSNGIIAPVVGMFLAAEISPKKVYLNELLSSPVRISNTRLSAHSVPSLIFLHMCYVFSPKGLFKQTDEKQLCWALDDTSNVYLFAKSLLRYLVLGMRVNMSAFPSSGSGKLYDLLYEGFLPRICNQHDLKANKTLAKDLAGLFSFSLELPFRKFGWEEIYRRLNIS